MKDSEPLSEDRKLTDEELVRDWAKCGIYHNHGHNESRVKQYLAILDSVFSQFKSKDNIPDLSERPNLIGLRKASQYWKDSNLNESDYSDKKSAYLAGFGNGFDEAAGQGYHFTKFSLMDETPTTASDKTDLNIPEPDSQWISVKDRLPKIGEPVLWYATVKWASGDRIKRHFIFDDETTGETVGLDYGHTAYLLKENSDYLVYDGDYADEVVTYWKPFSPPVKPS